MTSRLRLCFFVTSSLTATTFLGGYLKFLSQDGWDVTLICSDGPGLTELERTEGVQVSRLRIEREPAPIQDITSAVKAFMLLRRLSPDVVVYATPKASLVGAISAWLARVPHRVYELWGLRLETSRGWIRPVIRVLEWVTASASTKIIANSRSVAERSKQMRVNAGHNPVVLGNGSSHGVDADYFRRDAEMDPLDSATAEFINSGTEPVVGFVGRLHPDKGIDTLVEALQLCAEDGVAVRALIVGGEEGGDAPSRTPLRRIVPTHFTGQVADPRPYYAAIDLLTLPSRREGFPNVVLEAAAMQVPAVVSDATGCVDAVTQEVTGFIVPVNSATALAGAIKRLVNDASLRDRFGRAGRARAVAEFAQERVWAAHSREWRSSHREVDG